MIPKVFFQTRKLHIWVRLGNKEQIHPLSVCGPVALSRQYYNRHTRLHKFHKFEDLVVGDSDASVADTMTYRPGRACAVDTDLSGTWNFQTDKTWAELSLLL